MRISCVEILGQNVTHKKGFAFKSEWFKSEGHPIIKVTNFTDNSIDDSNLVFVDESIYNEHLEYLLRMNDVIIQTVGSWPNNPASVVGKVIKVPNRLNGALLNQNAVVLHPNKKINKGFFYYLLKSDNFKGYIINTAQGAANQASITLDSIFRYNFYLPSFPIQEKIAAILSAYDDLIENNNRRIAILEKMAEELYLEWFVRLRFPGHEKVKLVKGMPEGWEVKRIGDVFSTYLGGTPSRENSSFWGGDIPWINSGEINKPRIIKETEFITQAGYDSSATKLMPIHTTVLAITGATLGQFSFTEIKVCANQSVVGIFDKNDIYNFYIYGFIRASIPIIISKQGGGGQQHINKDIVEKELIIVPPADLVRRYNQKAIPVFEETANLYFSNEVLKKSRDRLLSRLMSGKIDVENTDIQFPSSMRCTEPVEAQEESVHA